MNASTYRRLRDQLFKLDAEEAHHLSLKALRLASQCGILPWVTPKVENATPFQCMGLAFPNRVGLAAGLDKEGNCIDALGALGFGFVEIGTITPRPQVGNPQPRLFRIIDREAIVNRMGFNNPGIQAGVHNVQQSQKFQGIIGFNIGKNKDTPNENAIDDYLITFREAYPVADYIAVNLSSPNTPGLRDLQAADATARLIEALQQERETLHQRWGKWVPITLKVAPDLEEVHLKQLAEVFLQCGLDAVIATNTTLDRRKVEGSDFWDQPGGLSGAPLTQRANEVVAAFHAELGGKIPIIGVGGIMYADDAEARIKAGASLVQLYSGFIYHGPPLVHDCIKRLNSLPH